MKHNFNIDINDNDILTLNKSLYGTIVSGWYWASLSNISKRANSFGIHEDSDNLSKDERKIGMSVRAIIKNKFI